MVKSEHDVIKMQDRLGEPLTGNCRRWQSLQCSVQIIGKVAGGAPLERRETRVMLLRKFGEKAAKSAPWIAGESLTVARRLSLRNYVGAERVASHIRIAPERLVLRCAIEKRQVGPLCERSHRRNRFDPVQFPDVHWALAYRSFRAPERPRLVLLIPPGSASDSTLVV